MTITSISAAKGAILGAFVSDAAGATLEFLGHDPSVEEVNRALQMVGGGCWGTAPGQITDDSELALSLLHALVSAFETSTPELEQVALFYQRWLNSPPFDIGMTTRRGLSALPFEGEMLHEAMWRNATQASDSKANGGLMRVTPWGIWGSRQSSEKVVTMVRQEQSLTHCNPSCQDSSAAYVLAIRHLILHPGDHKGAFSTALQWLQQEGEAEVLEWMQMAEANEDVGYTPMMGFVKYGFVHAFRHLKQQTDFVQAIKETLLGGGDTDTNACIVGGLLGACYGEEAIPAHQREALFSCDVSLGRPRPEWLQTRAVVAELLGKLVKRLSL